MYSGYVCVWERERDGVFNHCSVYSERTAIIWHLFLHLQLLKASKSTIRCPILSRCWFGIWGIWRLTRHGRRVVVLLKPSLERWGCVAELLVLLGLNAVCSNHAGLTVPTAHCHTDPAGLSYRVTHAHKCTSDHPRDVKDSSGRSLVCLTPLRRSLEDNINVKHSRKATFHIIFQHKHRSASIDLRPLMLFQVWEITTKLLITTNLKVNLTPGLRSGSDCTMTQTL